MYLGDIYTVAVNLADFQELQFPAEKTVPDFQSESR